MTPLTRETLTPTQKNPYPDDGYGFWSGQGMGSPGIPQGYPCQSLNTALTKFCYGLNEVAAVRSGPVQVLISRRARADKLNKCLINWSLSGPNCYCWIEKLMIATCTQLCDHTSCLIFDFDAISSARYHLTRSVKVMALMCDLHELLVGKLKEFLKEESFSSTRR